MDYLKDISKEIALSLKLLGVRNVFGIPGENPFIFQFIKEHKINIITCHHETYSAIAAGYSFLSSSRPEICYSSLGPGATNVISGISSCLLDEIPLICLIETSLTNDFLQSHQIIPQSHIYKYITKAYYSLSDIHSVKLIMEQAFAKAFEPPYGPIVIAIPIREKLPLVKPFYNKNYITSKNNISDISFKLKNETFYNDSNLFILGPRAPYIKDEIIDQIHRNHNSVIITTLMGKRAINEIKYNCKGWIDRNGSVFIYDKNDSLNYFLYSQQFSNIFCVNFCASEEMNFLYQKNSLTYFYLNSFVSERHIPKIINSGWKLFIGDPNNFLKSLIDKFQYRIDKKSIKESYNILDDPSIAITIDTGTVKRKFGGKIKSSSENHVFISNGFSLLGSQLAAAIGLAFTKKYRGVLCFIGDGGFLMSCTELNTIMHYNLPIAIIVTVNNSYLQIKNIQLKYTKNFAGTNFPVPKLDLIANSFGFESIAISGSTNLSKVLNLFLNNPHPTIIEIIS